MKIANLIRQWLIRKLNAVSQEDAECFRLKCEQFSECYMQPNDSACITVTQSYTTLLNPVAYPKVDQTALVIAPWSKNCYIAGLTVMHESLIEASEDKV